MVNKCELPNVKIPDACTFVQILSVSLVTFESVCPPVSAPDNNGVKVVRKSRESLTDVPRIPGYQSWVALKIWTITPISTSLEYVEFLTVGPAERCINVVSQPFPVIANSFGITFLEPVGIQTGVIFPCRAKEAKYVYCFINPKQLTYKTTTLNRHNPTLNN